MKECPFCKSNIYFSLKKNLYRCENCGNEFSKLNVNDHKKSLFFSYGNDINAKIVFMIKKDLEMKGYHIWIDKYEIKSGDNWRRSITDGILNSNDVIAFMSKHSVRQPNGVCLEELKIALSVKGGNIKTVLMESEEEVNPPASLCNNQWLDMSEWKIKKSEGKDAWSNWYDNKLAELIMTIENDESIAFDGEIETLRAYLQPSIVDIKEQQLLGNNYVGRKWLDQKLEEWRTGNIQSKACIIYGCPGAGKSMFTANLIHYNPFILCGLFCEWDKPFFSSTENIIRTMAFKLAARLPDYRKLLLRTILSVNDLQIYNANELFGFLILGPLNNCIDGARERQMIIIDGLDEANDADNNIPFTEVLEKNIALFPKWIGLILTSRPESEITAAFTGLYTINLNEFIDENNTDIKCFLQIELHSKLLQFVNKESMLQSMVEKCEGSFLYASMLSDAIHNGDINIGDISMYPRGVGPFYRLNFKRKFPLPDDYLAIRGYLELLCVNGNIPEIVLQSILSSDTYSFHSFKSKLGSLLTKRIDTFPYTKDVLVVLTFTHKTIMDWLTDEDVAGSFYIDKQIGIRKIAEYALFKVKQDKIIVQKPNRYLVSSCPQISIDLCLDYLQTNLSSFLIRAKLWNEYEEFLLELNTPFNAYWYGADNFPSSRNINPIIKKFISYSREPWEDISFGNLSGASKLENVFKLLSNIIKTKRFAQVFFAQFYPRHIDRFFRSSASDDYNCKGPGIFNEDKINAAYYMYLCCIACSINGISIPQKVVETLERIKLSCLFYEGQVDFETVECIFMNCRYLFEDNICVPNEKIKTEFNFINYANICRWFNTFCMIYELAYSISINKDHIERLVKAGVDIKYAVKEAIVEGRCLVNSQNRIKQIKEMMKKYYATRT